MPKFSCAQHIFLSTCRTTTDNSHLISLASLEQNRNVFMMTKTHTFHYVLKNTGYETNPYNCKKQSEYSYPPIQCIIQFMSLHSNQSCTALGREWHTPLLHQDSSLQSWTDSLSLNQGLNFFFLFFHYFSKWLFFELLLRVFSRYSRFLASFIK